MTFRKGQSGNKSGRPRVVGEIRDLARKFGPTGIAVLEEIATDKEQPARARVEAVKELFVRGYGKILSASDMFLISAASAKNPDNDEVLIQIGFGKDGKGISIEELQREAAKPKPPKDVTPPVDPFAAPRTAIEDLRPEVAAEKARKLEQAKADYERYRAIAEGRMPSWADE
jgi:hypothetical protein